MSGISLMRLQAKSTALGRSYAGTVRRPLQTQRRVTPGLSRIQAVQVKAADSSDDELEKRLAKLRQAKGAKPYGEGSKKKEVKARAQDAKEITKGTKKMYDFTDEVVQFEGGPAQIDLILNCILGASLVWLPLTIAAIARTAFVKYRFTDKRLSVTTSAPWKAEQLDVAYQEVKSVATVPRWIGFCGDMVVTLNDDTSVEVLRIEGFRDLKNYILERRDALTGGPQDPLDADFNAPAARAGSRKGFS